MRSAHAGSFFLRKNTMLWFLNIRRFSRFRSGSLRLFEAIDVAKELGISLNPLFLFWKKHIDLLFYLGFVAMNWWLHFVFQVEDKRKPRIQQTFRWKRHIRWFLIVLVADDSSVEDELSRHLAHQCRDIDTDGVLQHFREQKTRANQVSGSLMVGQFKGLQRLGWLNFINVGLTEQHQTCWGQVWVICDCA